MKQIEFNYQIDDKFYILNYDLAKFIDNKALAEEVKGLNSSIIEGSIREVRKWEGQGVVSESYVVRFGYKDIMHTFSYEQLIAICRETREEAESKLLEEVGFIQFEL